MTKRTAFPTVSLIASILGIAIIIFLFTVPRNYLMSVTYKMRAAALNAYNAVLDGNFETTDKNISDMCEVLEQSEKTLKLFLNHEDVDELRASLHSAQALSLIEESGNLITELQDIIRILNYWDDSETLNIYNLF